MCILELLWRSRWIAGSEYISSQSWKGRVGHWKQSVTKGCLALLLPEAANGREKRFGTGRLIWHLHCIKTLTAGLLLAALCQSNSQKGKGPVIPHWFKDSQNHTMAEAGKGVQEVIWSNTHAQAGSPTVVQDCFESAFHYV